MKLKLLMAGAALVAMSAGAWADITRTFDITASGFTDLVFGPGGVAPIDPVTLDFTLTWDPTAVFGATTTGLTINSLNLPYTSAIAGEPGSLTIATDPFSNGCTNVENSYCAFISNPAGGTPDFFFFQQTVSDGSFWEATSVSGTASAITPRVPEPATWALMLIGFAGIGGLLRFCGRKTVAA
jgi:PEP-CTERM motif